MADYEKKPTAGDPTSSPGDEGAEGWAPHHGMSASTYLATRLSTLKPAMMSAPNPIRVILSLNRQNWSFFMIAFLAWVSQLLSPSHENPLQLQHHAAGRRGELPGGALSQGPWLTCNCWR